MKASLLSLFLVIPWCDFVVGGRRFREAVQKHRAWVDDWLEAHPLVAGEEDDLATTSVCPCKDTSLCRPIKGHPIRRSGEVLGFTASGAAKNVSYMNWTHVSTVAWAQTDEWMCQAHANGARVILGAGSYNLTEMATNSSLIQEWVAKMVRMVKATHRDGVTFDTESPMQMHSAIAKTYVRLIRETKIALHAANPSYQVTVCVAWSPDGIDGRTYPYLDLSKASDALYVMDYDTRSQIYDACIAAANAPYFGMVKGVQRYFELGIPPTKLILGVPWYGYSYPCLNGTSIEDRFCPISEVPFRGVNCSDAAGYEIAVLSIQRMLLIATNNNNLSAALPQYDTYQDAAYVNMIAGTSSSSAAVVHQYWYDTPLSLEHKCSWARQQGLAGVGPYSYDDLSPDKDPDGVVDHTFSQSLWTALDMYMVGTQETKLTMEQTEQKV